MPEPAKNEPGTRNKPKRKGVWAEVHTFEHPESGLVCIITERTRGVPAYSFQIGHMDDKGFNKFIPCPVPGTIDVEHIVKSLAENAREFIAKKVAEDVKLKKDSKKDRKSAKKDAKDDKKSTRRGGRGKGNSKGDRRSKNGLSTLAREDAAAGGHEYIGPTRRRREKKRAAKQA